MTDERLVRRCHEIESREQFGKLLNKRGLVGEAAEIGTHLGIFAEQFLSGWGGQVLHCVDPWQTALPGYVDDITDRDREQDYQAARERLSQFGERVRFHRLTSVEAAPAFPDESLDFVYIDANHATEHVRQDVLNWWPKIKPHGIMAGHDWTGEWRSKIRRGVLSFTVPRGLWVQLVECPIGYRSWFVEKS
jgi:hypothetical protein